MESTESNDQQNQLSSWFHKLWMESFLPEAREIVAGEKGDLILPEGVEKQVSEAFVTIWNCVNGHMKTDDGKPKKMDRHKIAACVAAAILHVRVLKRSNILDKGSPRAHFANEILAFYCALNTLASFIFTGFDQGELQIDPNRILDLRKTGFRMPPTPKNSDTYDQHIYLAFQVSRTLRYLPNSQPSLGMSHNFIPVDILLLSTILYHIELYNLETLPIITIDKDEPNKAAL
ncbi:MAG: hypothetical protein H7833_15160 [Magnetococcus sp. DMHC-1]|nr:hypothetical protein [Magnetococcales bacterium]